MVYIFGDSETARVMKSYLEEQGAYYCGILIDREYLTKNPEWNKQFVIEEFREPNTIPHPQDYLYFPIISNSVREAKFKQAKNWGFQTPPLIHKKAYVASDAVVGEASWVQEHCNVQTGSKVGEGCILWASAHVGHGSTIGNFVFITTGCVVCGGCSIGDRTFLGANSVITPNVKVGKDCFIAAGAIITKDLPDGAVAYEGRNNIKAYTTYDKSN